MHRLMAPLMAQSAGDKISKGCPLVLYKSLIISLFLFSLSLDTGSNAVLLSHILDLLSVCVEKHSYYIRKYTIDRNLLGRVLVLMTSAHRHLTLGLFSLSSSSSFCSSSSSFSSSSFLSFMSVLSFFCLYFLYYFLLAALRLCRKVVGLKDDSYNHYIVKHDLFAPIVKTLVTNGDRYNMVNSAILEMFEFIKSVSIHVLVFVSIICSPSLSLSPSLSPPLSLPLSPSLFSSLGEYNTTNSIYS